MPADPPTNDPPQADPPSPDLLEDLKAYDNPESFFDQTLLHKLQILSTPLENQPTILTIEVNGEDLKRVFEEVFLDWAARSPDSQQGLVEDYGAKDWAEAREQIKDDPDFRRSVAEAYWFFVRQFPKLMVRLYEILIAMSAQLRPAAPLDHAHPYRFR